MNPEELTKLVDEAVSRGPLFSWWSYLIALVLPFVGGYLGAYAKKKGEDLATKESFDSLLEQVQKTTATTEGIKAELAKGSWLHQQEWYLKEKYYSGVLDALYRFKRSLSAQLDHYMEPGSEHHDATINEREHFKRQDKLGNEALQDLQRLHGPAEIVISKRAIEALETFYSADWHASNFSVCNKEYLSDVYRSAKEAHRVILEEARAELR